MVSHLAIHSSCTQVTDAYLTAQFGQLLLSVCDAGYFCDHAPDRLISPPPQQ